MDELFHDKSFKPSHWLHSSIAWDAIFYIYSLREEAISHLDHPPVSTPVPATTEGIGQVFGRVVKTENNGADMTCVGVCVCVCKSRKHHWRPWYAVTWRVPQTPTPHFFNKRHDASWRQAVLCYTSYFTILLSKNPRSAIAFFTENWRWKL